MPGDFQYLQGNVCHQIAPNLVLLLFQLIRYDCLSTPFCLCNRTSLYCVDRSGLCRAEILTAKVLRNLLFATTTDIFGVSRCLIIVLVNSVAAKDQNNNFSFYFTQITKKNSIAGFFLYCLYKKKRVRTTRFD